MSVLKKLLWGTGILIAALVLFCAGYWLTYRQGVIDGSSIETPGATRRILLASQGSDYKEALVRKLVTRLQADSASVRLVDVTQLPTVNEADYDAAILICSIEYYAAQKDVAAYIAAAQQPERIVLHTTSGQGDMPPQQCRIDALTGASKAELLDEKVTAILARLPWRAR